MIPSSHRTFCWLPEVSDERRKEERNEGIGDSLSASVGHHCCCRCCRCRCRCRFRCHAFWSTNQRYNANDNNVPCVYESTLIIYSLLSQTLTHVLHCDHDLENTVTGRPNIDWCEDHKAETVRTNVIGVLNVADLTSAKGIHLTVYATGCIYSYDEAHPLGSGIGFTEEDIPNFDGSWYSRTKGYVEPMLKAYPNTLVLRVRMPVSDDLIHRNFVTKIVKYEKVVNIPNSMTIMHEMLPASWAMAVKGLIGVYNFTNPGVISHNEVLDLYKKYIDPTYTYTNFTLEEQDKILKAPRSNNELDTTKLMRDMPECVVINDIKTAYDLCFQRMKVNLTKMGWLPDNMPAEFVRKPKA